MSEICFFGETYFRDQSHKFGIKTDDRRRHMYVIGKTGMGKTTLLENMVYSDIVNGHGLCYVDPHGDTAEKILEFIPSNRINDVIYFNPADMDNPISFNVLESVDKEYTHLVASGMIGVFKKIWADSWGPRLEYILRNALLALLDHPDSTLLGVTRILVDNNFRKKVVANIKDPVVRSFWVDEFTKWNERTLAEVISPIQNKVGQFLSTALIRNIVGQVKSSISFRDIMDNKKILILNLSKGRIGEDSSSLLGAMMITKIQLAAMSRVNIPEEEREDFYLYVDEFQNFATDSFAGILSEARKYRLSLILAHQYVAQLDEKVSDAIFGNVGTIVNFRVGAADAEVLVKEFAPFFEEQDFVNLPKFFIYLKLMIDGVSSNPFSARTLPPLSKNQGNQQKIIKVSRERYTKEREVVEDKIMRWSGHGDAIDGGGSSNSKPEGKYTYTCDACKKQFSLNVELDPTKPLFCKDCLVIRKNRKEQGLPNKSYPKTPAKVEPAQPEKPSTQKITNVVTPQRSIGTVEKHEHKKELSFTQLNKGKGAEFKRKNTFKTPASAMPAQKKNTPRIVKDFDEEIKPVTSVTPVKSVAKSTLNTVQKVSSIALSTPVPISSPKSNASESLEKKDNPPKEEKKKNDSTIQPGEVITF